MPKNMCFSGNLTATSPKKFASPCYVFGWGFLDKPLPKSSLPFARNPWEISAPFRSVPKVLNLGGQGSQGCESAHKANFQNPYATFLVGICCYSGLILFFWGGPKPKSNDICFWVAVCFCFFSWSTVSSMIESSGVIFQVPTEVRKVLE